MTAGETEDYKQVGGDVRITAGLRRSTDASSDVGDGGSLVITAGANTYTDTGGDVLISAGNAATDIRCAPEQAPLRRATAASAMYLFVGSETVFFGVSGDVQLQTGGSSEGTSRKISQGTGDAQDGRGGDITLSVGRAGSTNGDTPSNGGNVVINAGETDDAASTGGSVSIVGGFGSSEDELNGGDGGSVMITGGASAGLDDSDKGGSLVFTAGEAERVSAVTWRSARVATATHTQRCGHHRDCSLGCVG